MRKIIAIITALTLVFMMSTPVNAAQRAYISAWPGLEFNGTTATCSLIVYAGHTTDSIQASVSLTKGNVTVAQWNNLTASGYMTFSRDILVAQGATYAKIVEM